MNLNPQSFEDWCGRADGRWIPDRSDRSSIGVCKMTPDSGYREVELVNSGSGYGLVVTKYDQWHSVDDNIEVHNKNIVIEDSRGNRSEIGRNAFPI